MLRVTCHCENAVKSAKKSFGSSNGKCDSSVADIAGGSTITVFTAIKKLVPMQKMIIQEAAAFVIIMMKLLLALKIEVPVLILV
ncbi:MAG TPA: hypothetical protein VE619_04485 [Nitrososphaeraceae archaeon]|nr:hypothetical protein [Nitrososphaeraceae archaeon]